MNERTFNASEAHKLEDPERLLWLPPGEVIARLPVKIGMMVADIGAGTGFFAIPFARHIGPDGRVFAVDLQREMLDILQSKLSGAGMPGNIGLHPGTATATGLIDRSVDLVFLANIWHELDDHPAVLGEAARILAPGGRISVLDWRPDVERPPGPRLDHRIAMDKVELTLSTAGWRCLICDLIGRHSYLVVAEPPASQ